MKKLTSLLAVFLFTLSLAACAGTTEAPMEEEAMTEETEMVETTEETETVPETEETDTPAE